MKSFTKIIAVFGLLVFSVVTLADSKPLDVFAALDKAGISYVYSTNGTLIILRTEQTAAKVDIFVDVGTISGRFPYIDVQVVDNLLEAD